jgi:hypothetical protein
MYLLDPIRLYGVMHSHNLQAANFCSGRALMMEAARTSETPVDNYFTRQYIPEDKSELHARLRENLKSHKFLFVFIVKLVPDISSVNSCEFLLRMTAVHPCKCNLKSDLILKVV